MAVGDPLVQVRTTLLLLWLGVFLFLSGWPQIVHCQYHSPPEVAISVRITGIGRNIKAPGWLSYSLCFGEQSHIVHMKTKSNLVSRYLSVFTYTDEGALLENQPFDQSDCYYHGYMEGDPESLVALSTCFGGFQGIARKRNISNVQRDVSLIINEVDSFYSSVEVDMVLLGIKIWIERNPTAINDLDAVLPEFCKWKVSLNSCIKHDAVHLIVKKEYGRFAGLSYLGTECTLVGNCLAVSFLDDQMLRFAFITACEFGHTLGMPHDRSPCICGEKICIMSPTVNITYRFSNCCYEMLFTITVKVTCLRGLPNPETIFTHKYGGNGVVTEGEDCDCGSLSLCTKYLCCLVDCTLKAGSACAFGLCCKDGQFLPSGHLCREKHNECDLPEWYK
ncbi:hypothetical protein H8959_003798 [Pygathrix nigripes]